MLSIDNPCFKQMASLIYPYELELNKANSTNTEAPYLDLDLSINIGIVSPKFNDEQDVDFKIHCS